MLLKSKIYKNFFILCLISSPPTSWKTFVILCFISSHPRAYFFYFTALSVVTPTCQEDLFWEKYKKFLASRFISFFGLSKFPPKMQKSFFWKKYEFFKLGARKFHFPKKKKLFQCFFYFSTLESFLLKYKKFLKVGSRKFHIPKYKNFFAEKIFLLIDFFNLGAWLFLKYRENLCWKNKINFFQSRIFYFFYFSNLGWKVWQVALKSTVIESTLTYEILEK